MNGILLVDKPQDWTSHDVVAKLRGICGQRRIGHSGTLDPMATGLLVVFLGRATRAVQFAESDEKEYLAGVKFGIVTDTQDTSGNILKTSDIKVSREEIEKVLPLFTGEIMQIPPMYSAIKKNGQKLYDLARKGIEVERDARKITIKNLELIDGAEEFGLKVVCSKGTYVRTLCHDIGEKLGCGAAMSSLRRIRAGAFSVDNAHTLEEIAENGAEKYILPVDTLFSQKPDVKITEKQKTKCLCGNSFKLDVPDGEYRVYGPDGDFLMLGRAEENIMHTVKSFFEVQ